MTDIVTRCLNHFCMSPAEIKMYGNKIWRTVFELDLVDSDLGLLPPNHLPTIHNGLGLVKSKRMYQKLCLLRPDLIQADILKAYLHSDRDELKRLLSPLNISPENALTTLSSSLINVVLRNKWFEELPSWWNHIRKTPKNEPKVRVFVLACCMGHVNLAKSLYNKALGQRDNTFKLATTNALEHASKLGNQDGVEFLLSLGSVQITPNLLSHALYNGHNDILRTLLKCYWNRRSAYNNIFVRACQDGRLNAVETLLGFTVFFTIPAVWLWVKRNVDGNTLRSKSGKGFNSGEICNEAFLRAASRGNLEMVRLFAAVAGVDLAGARSIAMTNGQSEVVEFLNAVIKTVIINKSDLVTRCLNNDLSALEIEKYGNKIWRLVFEWNLVDFDLSLIPQQHLPTIHNGLGLVKSKQMYKKLALLRPDLIQINVLKSLLQSEKDRRWLLPSLEPSTDQTELTTLSLSLVNILLRNEWFDELPYWWNPIYSTDDDHPQLVRIFFMASCMGHVNIARSLYNRAQLNANENSLEWVTRKALEYVSKFGNQEGVEFLLSLPFDNPATPFGNNPLSYALYNCHTDILKMLLKSFRHRYPQHTFESGFTDLVVMACQNDNVKAVDTLLGLTEYFPTLPEIEGRWRSKAVFVATNYGRVDIMRFLLGCGMGFDTSDICKIPFKLVAAKGQLEMVRLFAVVEGVDLAGARLIAMRQGHTEIVEFLTGLL
ncbi:hypothetical protein HDU76_004418 [Blyttiomyces sp. JEL0837]|nr:hypothetical protein HDU76_004418 [Blyttiomyces sp. JEL0837]